MASIQKLANGSKRLAWCENGRRVPPIYLGKCSAKQAEHIKGMVEELIRCKALGSPRSVGLEQWLRSIDGTLRMKLEKAGLVAVDVPPPEPEEPTGTTLGDWLDHVADVHHAHHKKSTVASWGHTFNNLLEHFGPNRPLNSVSVVDAREFQRFLVSQGLRPATVQKRITNARSVFKLAVEDEQLASNPFTPIKQGGGDVRERRSYVPAETILSILPHLPTDEWRLLIVLSRFCGFRTPSEHLWLRWEHVEFNQSILRVPEPKLEHKPGRGLRAMPIFPEVRPFLHAAYNAPNRHPIFVFADDEWRRRADGPNGLVNANFRTVFRRAVQRAGFKPWTRTFQSLRSSCETDLVKLFPLAKVALWLGNTSIVAMRNYIDQNDADFLRATGFDTKAQSKAQQAAEGVKNAGNVCAESKTPTAIFPSFLSSSPSLYPPKMGVTGFEPVTSTVFSERDTHNHGATELTPLQKLHSMWGSIPAEVRAVLEKLNIQENAVGAPDAQHVE